MFLLHKRLRHTLLLASVCILAIPTVASAGYIPPGSDTLLGTVAFDGIRVSSDPDYVADYDALAGSFVIEVFSVAGDAHSVIFSFVNKYSGVQMDELRIGAIFFDDRVPILNQATLMNTSGVEFKVASGNGQLPGGGPLNPTFAKTFHAAEDGGAANGIDPGEAFGIKYSLFGTYTAADTLAAFINGTDLRVGIHVRGLDGNPGSYSYITTPPTVPEPGTFGLLALGAIGLGGYAKRRKAM